MSYDPRQYWSDRARREGKKYVAYKNRADAFRGQVDVFVKAMRYSLPECENILDFGCGVGRFAPFASELAENYEGVDITAEALEHVPSIDNANFTHLSEDRLPFPDEHFDAAIAVTVIQHIVDPDDFDLWTSELSRVVKQGGKFFIIDTPAPKKKVKRGFHMMWRTPWQIARALGAEVVTNEDISAEFENSHYAFLARKKWTTPTEPKS